MLTSSLIGLSVSVLLRSISSKIVASVLISYNAPSKGNQTDFHTKRNCILHQSKCFTVKTEHCCFISKHSVSPVVVPHLMLSLNEFVMSTFSHSEKPLTRFCALSPLQIRTFVPPWRSAVPECRRFYSCARTTESGSSLCTIWFTFSAAIYRFLIYCWSKSEAQQSEEHKKRFQV